MDRARHAIRAGDPLPEVGSAYARLSGGVGPPRRGKTVRSPNCSGCDGRATDHDDLQPVEDVLAKVVAPTRPGPHQYLLLVLDGLSFAVWQRARWRTVAGGSAGPNYRRIEPRRTCRGRRRSAIGDRGVTSEPLCAARWRGGTRLSSEPALRPISCLVAVSRPDGHPGCSTRRSWVLGRSWVRCARPLPTPGNASWGWSTTR